MTKAEVIRRLVALNIPLYDVPATMLVGQRRLVKRRKVGKKAGGVKAAAPVGVRAAITSPSSSVGMCFSRILREWWWCGVGGEG